MSNYIIKLTGGTYDFTPHPFNGAPLWPSTKEWWWTPYVPGQSKIILGEYYTVFTKNEIVMTRLSSNINWDNVLFYEYK